MSTTQKARKVMNNHNSRSEEVEEHAGTHYDHLRFGSYLPDDAERRMREYVYRGTDRSLVYQYVWRPFCTKLVTFLPVWLSANVISIAALLLVCCSHLLLAFYIPSFAVEEHNISMQDDFVSPPSFVFILSALSLIAYPILDNLDGHQARRTCMASPLGLIIDHGCDAFNCIVLSLSISASTSSGSTWKTWFFLLCMVIGFFMNTWEEYCLGELVLPLINGANEGVLLAIGIFLFTAWVGGPQWWNKNGLDVPASYVPAVLTFPPPEATVKIESEILKSVCPWINPQLLSTSSDNNNNNYYYYYSNNNNGNNALSFLSVFLGLNCSSEYINSPPVPIPIPNTIDQQHGTGSGDYKGHNMLQNFILGLYDTSNPKSFWLRYNTIIVLFFVLSTLITVLGNVFHVYSAVHKNNGRQVNMTGRMGSKLRFMHALSRLWPLGIMTFFSTLWLLTSPSDIFKRHPRIFCWTFGLLYTKSSIHLMIAHVCSIKFHPLRRTLWPFLFIATHITLTYYSSVIEWIQNYHVGNNLGFPDAKKAWDIALGEEQILLFFFTLSVWTFIHLVVSVVRETAAKLEVPIFTVPRSKQEALRRKIEEARAMKNTKK